MKRVFVALDVEYIWYSTKDVFGKNFRVDFRKLRDFIIDEFPDSQLEAVAYVFVVANGQAKSNFVDMLERHMYKVKEVYKKGETSAANKIAITIDALLKSLPTEDDDRGIDEFVLVSGDADYSELCAEVSFLETQVTVVGHEAAIDKNLSEKATRILHIPSSAVFSVKSR